MPATPSAPRRRLLAEFAVGIALLAVRPATAALPDGSGSADDVTRDSVVPHWTADGSAFWYQRKEAGGRYTYWWVDAVAGTRRPAFDAMRLAAGVSMAGGVIDPLPGLLIDDVRPEADGTVVVAFDGKHWAIPPTDGPAVERPGPAAPSVLRRLDAVRRSASRGDPSAKVAIANHTASPVKVAFVDDRGNLGPHPQTIAATGDEWSWDCNPGSVFAVTDATGATPGVYEATEESCRLRIDPPAPTTRPATGPMTRPETVPATTRATTTTSAPADEADAVVSPDGRWVALVRDHDLYVRDRQAGGGETRLTRDGTEDDGYGYTYETTGRAGVNPIQWSADGRHLLALRTRRGLPTTRWLVQSAPPGGGPPRGYSWPSYRVGDRIPVTTPHLFDVPAGREMATDAGRWSGDTLSTWGPEWDQDIERFTFFTVTRGATALRRLAIDPATGQTTAVFDDRSRTFIDEWNKFFDSDLSNGHETLWASERDGWNHLYLSDLATGRIEC